MTRKRNKSTPAMIDIVITTAGRFDMLEKCLARVYQEAQTTPLSITIIDIDSPAEERISNSKLFVYDATKDPAKGVKDFFEHRFSQNVGFPAGANAGAKYGRAPLIMFLGDDVEVWEGSIQKVVDSFKDETVGVVGMKLLFPESSTSPNRPPGKIQHIGLALNIRGVPVHPLVGWSPDIPRTQGSRDCWAVTGAAFTIRRDLFTKARGFDVIYGLGTHEDCDLCMKVTSMGKRIYLNGDAVGYHYTGASAEKRRQPFPLQQNLQIFQSRWGQSGLMRWSDWEYW